MSGTKFSEVKTKLPSVTTDEATPSKAGHQSFQQILKQLPKHMSSPRL
ncbi:hypothetical protein I6G91_02715 [Fannyhessea vaginae]|nr:hypothetical protein [Fannyhessea vaginae]QPR42232.1 hypothetical protein I6G91_02715 [Fannyhessea vaginae]